MGAGSLKIINDPVYGFITIDHPLILEVIRNPFYQRLRRIQQMGFANLVYPGAVHTRLHHSLGAYHLMCNALATLRKEFPLQKMKNWEQNWPFCYMMWVMVLFRTRLKKF
jgi:HD superfamily phosphohydrolase